MVVNGDVASILTTFYKMDWYVLNPTLIFSLWMVYLWSLLLTPTLIIALSSMLSINLLEITHVTSNLVLKLFQVQTIVLQPFFYFEFQVSKDDLSAFEVKQKSFKRTCYTLILKSLNNLLYQVWIFINYFSIVSLSIVLKSYISSVSSKWLWNFSVASRT
jgi:hypothetical protein